MEKGPKMESLGEFFGWLKSNCPGRQLDIRPKVAFNKAFLTDVFQLVTGNPFCTAEFVANQLGVNFESAYLGLKALRDRGLIIDVQGEYAAIYRMGDPC